MEEIEEEVEFLGVLAAQCDVWAVDPHNSITERFELALRADRYRDLQVATMYELPERTK